MSWLARYYNQRARAGDRRDFLKQVFHTEGGQSISDAQFQSMLAGIRAALDLRPDDMLLDLCCGNGVFTRPLAGDVRRAVGIDFSTELIAIARKHNRPENAAYHVQDVKRLDLTAIPEGPGFSKILMNAALQHFTPREFTALLETLLAGTTSDRVMLFGFVPDFSRRGSFLETLRPTSGCGCADGLGGICSGNGGSAKMSRTPAPALD